MKKVTSILILFSVSIFVISCGEDTEADKPKEVTKKVALGKINHKNAKKSCQIVLFSSKSATERPSSSTVVG